MFLSRTHRFLHLPDLSCPPKPKCEPPENVRLKLLHQPHRVKHLAHGGTPKRWRRYVGRDLFGPPGLRNFPRIPEARGAGQLTRARRSGPFFLLSRERGAAASVGGAGSVELLPLLLPLPPEQGARSGSLCRWSGERGAGASAAGAGSVERFPASLPAPRAPSACYCIKCIFR